MRAFRRRHGTMGAVSEVLYKGAHATARGPNETAFEDSRIVRSELERSKRALRADAKLLKRLTHRVERRDQTIAILRRELEEIRSGNMVFYRSEELASQACPACASAETFVTAYPYPRTRAFARVVCSWCRRCGFGWVPALPFSLSSYYEHEYAVANRGDRADDPARYFAELSGALGEARPHLVRYAERAQSQIAAIERLAPPSYDILDYGSGPGYALFFSRALTKHAVEPDGASAKYLEYLGVARLSLEDLVENRYDVVLSSHSLEHLELCELYPTLERLHAALRPGGIFLCEVPSGALTQASIERRHEPHTLFFNAESLRAVFENAGFVIIEQSIRTKGDGRDLSVKLAGTDSGTPANADGLTIVARKGGFARSMTTQAAVAATEAVRATDVSAAGD